MLEKITVELDLTKLDEHFHDVEDFKRRAKDLGLVYFNVGEGSDWTEAVEYKVL